MFEGIDIEEHLRCSDISNTGHTKKLLWGSLDGGQTKPFLLLFIRELSNVIGVNTGHLSLRSLLQKIGKACAEGDETL